ncbi:hypothetical protein CBM2629_A100099 [Cupriavidus taiwanensis]|nr:hypothetical protein CBM2629_A100099 [Cupriavidus taiwanensis]
MFWYFAVPCMRARLDGDLKPVWTDQQKGGIAMFRRIDAASASTQDDQPPRLAVKLQYVHAVPGGRRHRRGHGSPSPARAMSKASSAGGWRSPERAEQIEVLTTSRPASGRLPNPCRTTTQSFQATFERPKVYRQRTFVNATGSFKY